MPQKLSIACSILLLWVAPQSFAQWTCDKAPNCSTNPTKIYPVTTTAVVGVGTTNPLTILDVQAATNKHLAIRPSSDFGGLSTGIALSAFNDGSIAAIPLTIESSLLTLNSTNHSNVGIGTTTPGLLLDVKTLNYGWPATSGSTQTGILRLSQGGGAGVLDFGVAGTPQLGAWLQATASNSLGARYDILLNPMGGNVGIGIQGVAKAALALPNGVGAAGQIGIMGNAGSLSNKPGFFLGSDGNFSGASATAYFGFTAAMQGPSGNPNQYLTDFGIIGSSDSTTHRFLRIGYNTADDPSQPFNSKVAIDTYTGDITTTGSITGAKVINAVFQDVAEWVPATETLAPGTVVVLNPAKGSEVEASSAPYDTTVAGVVSEHPGIVLGTGAANKAQIATTGRVRVKVDATQGKIRVGDLLVTSAIAGTAMRSVPVEIAGISMHRPGTIIGKALEPLESGTGEILVLLSLQ